MQLQTSLRARGEAIHVATAGGLLRLRLAMTLLNDRISDQFQKQIAPKWVSFFNQLYLFCPGPTLDLLFPLDRRTHFIMNLEPNKQFAPVP
jgi:hypothetical protein